MLFRIKDLTLAQPNAPSWKTLFVQAAENHFMAHPSGHRLDRGRAANMEHFLANTQPHIARFLRRTIAGAITTVDSAIVAADRAIGLVRA
jgi:hypothetical protein